MKKSIHVLLLALAFTLLGCHHEGLSEDSVVPPPTDEVEAAQTTSAVFGISVDSIANGAVVTDASLPVEIAGTVSPAAVTITVNGRALADFTPGDETWRYVVEPSRGNLQPGMNTYEFAARNAEGFTATTPLTLNYDLKR